jgi:signal transduction histidine kinase
VDVYQRLRTLRPPTADVVLALVFSVAAVIAVLFDQRHNGPRDLPFYIPAPPGLRVIDVRPSDEGVDVGTALGSLLITLPLMWRRRLPLVAGLVVFLGTVVVHDRVTFVTFFAATIGVYSLAAHGRRPVVSMAVLLAFSIGIAVTFDQVTPPIPGWATPFALLLPIGLFGTTIRAARARADASAQRARALEHEQEAATRAAVAEERARIARDLHDVVSHHVSVMVIQAGAAGKVLDEQPDLARDSIEAIAASGREAMADLRHLLGLLNPAPDGAPPLQPQPGLDQLDALVAKVRAAGQPVTVSRSGPPPPWGLGQVAYRVIQEALTNALRYAPGARTEVAISSTGEELVVEVTNEEAAGAVAPAAGTGSGLLGLTERLRLYGGTLDAGSRLVGGFRVRASIQVRAQ